METKRFTRSRFTYARRSVIKCFWEIKNHPTYGRTSHVQNIRIHHKKGIRMSCGCSKMFLLWKTKAACGLVYRRTQFFSIITSNFWSRLWWRDFFLQIRQDKKLELFLFVLPILFNISLFKILVESADIALLPYLYCFYDFFGSINWSRKK